MPWDLGELIVQFPVINQIENLVQGVQRNAFAKLQINVLPIQEYVRMVVSLDTKSKLQILVQRNVMIGHLD